jgi:hypothetical protein
MKMKIETLNKIEKKKIIKFQKAWKRIVKRAVKKRGLTEGAMSLITKEAKILSKAMVESGLDLGIRWLESHVLRKSK